MKAYHTPMCEIALLNSEDVLTASATLEGEDYVIGMPDEFWRG